MRTSELHDLLDTVEQIRREKHPDLDQAFLTAVVRAEQANPEDDGEALQMIRAALKTLLESKGAA